MKRIVAETKKYVKELFERNSKTHLLYHNLTHTENVVKAVKLIGRQCGVSDYEMKVLQVAAWFHDVGYLETAEGHEEISKKYAREFLRRKGMDETFIAAVERCIDATKVPQQPTDKLSKILCDADLYHVAQGKFMKNTLNFWNEYAAMNNKAPDENESLKKTLRFLKDHHFHTEYGETLLETGKKENIKKVKARIQKKKK
jgi:predicted metal-dependent HD superfamily phosphohydrolase